MNRYEPKRFRPVIGVAAVALTALTIALTVVIPARLAPGTDATALAAAQRAKAGVREIAIIPARIDVIARRATSIAEAPWSAAPKAKQHG